MLAEGAGVGVVTGGCVGCGVGDGCGAEGLGWGAVVVSSGVGVGVGVGVGLGDVVGSSVAVVPTFARGGKSTTSSPAKMGAIMAVHTRVGMVDPVICEKPPNGVICSAEPSSPTW